MKRIALIGAGLAAALIAASCATGGAKVETAATGPAYDAAGKLMIPQNTDRWPTVGITVALQYEGDVGGQTINMVRMDPKSHAAYLATGEFPVGTMLELEIRRQAKDIQPARDGTFQGALVTHSIHIKDEKGGPGTWTFYGYPPSAKVGEPIARAANCYSCHAEHTKQDTVFTQFYPVLAEARAKVVAAGAPAGK